MSIWYPQSDDLAGYYDAEHADAAEVMAELRAENAPVFYGEDEDDLIAWADDYVPAECPGGCGADLHVDFCECSASNPEYWRSKWRNR